MSASTFTQGDLVTERTRPGDHVFTPSSPSYNQARRLAGSRRTGRVVAIRQTKASNGSRITYVDVLWDGRRSPSTHAACRLLRVATPA